MKQIRPQPSWLVVLALGVLSASAWAQQQQAQALDVKIGLDVLPTYLPADKSAAQNLFNIWGAKGTVPLMGRKIKFAAASRKGREFLAVDANGNGKFARNELHLIVKNESILIKLTLPAKEGLLSKGAIALSNIQVRTINNRVTGFSGHLLPSICFQASLAGEKVKLFDMNQDGKLTQDGNDAIQIGSSQAALPLGKVHRVNGKLVSLELQANGTALAGAILPTDGQLATIALPKNQKFDAVIVADDKGRCFNLALGQQVPAGKYRLIYGIARKDDKTARFDGALTTTMIECKPGNTVQAPYGKPLVGFSGSVANNTYVIDATMFVLGQGGELYTFDISHADGGVEAPEVELLKAGKPIEAVSMGYS